MRKSDVQPASSDQWLELQHETALEPELPIIDPHHHFISHGDSHYGFEELKKDIEGGHKVVATAHIECGENYRTDLGPAYASLGETQYVSEIIRKLASGPSGETRVCAGIVAYIDLRLGAAVSDVVSAHKQAAGKALKGVRNNSSYHGDPAVRSSVRLWPEGLLQDAKFLEGAACLAKLGLCFDTYLYHTQVDEVIGLARRLPDLRIVLDHVGGPLGVGPYRGKSDEVFATWQAKMAELARERNVFVKLGGLGMKIGGFDFHERPHPPTSDELVSAWSPYIVNAIERFGVERCVFESNFPVDRISSSYTVLWNAFKKIAANESPKSKRALFFGTARSVYGLDEIVG